MNTKMNLMRLGSVSKETRGHRGFWVEGVGWFRPNS